MPLMQCPSHGFAGGVNVCIHISDKAKERKCLTFISVVDTDLKIGNLEPKYFYCLDCAATFKLSDGQRIGGLLAEKIHPQQEILNALRLMCGVCFKDNAHNNGKPWRSGNE